MRYVCFLGLILNVILSAPAGAAPQPCNPPFPNNSTHCVKYRTSLTAAGLLAHPSYDTAYWNAHRCVTASNVVPRTSWQNDQDPNANPVPGVAPVMVNPKLDCCLNGWNGSPIVGKKMDCVEPLLNDGFTFDELYNLPDASGANVHYAEGIAFPNRLYLTNAQNQPVTGFYREDGVRCVPTGGEPTPATLFARMATALTSTNTAAFLNANGFESRCVFVLRTALNVSCPAHDTNPAAIDFSVAPDPQPVGIAKVVPLRRCAAAERIRVEFDIRDISQNGRRGRTAMRSYSSLAVNNANGLINNVVPLAPIDYRTVLVRKLLPGSTVGCPQFTTSTSPTANSATPPAIAPGLIPSGGICVIAPP
jgi:hypothetical protein